MRPQRSLNGVARASTLFNLAYAKHLPRNYDSTISCDGRAGGGGGDAFASC